MAIEKKELGFFKTSLLGAVLVVVPVGIIGFSLWQIVRVVRALLLPVLDWLNFASEVTELGMVLGALVVVVLMCYVTGVAVRTRWGRRMRVWFEGAILEKIPGYGMIRTLVHQYLGDETERRFRPVLVDQHGSGALTIGFEIEELGEELVAVFFPSVPAVTLGRVEVIPAERVIPIKASMHDTIEALTMFGVGVSNLVDDEVVKEGAASAMGAMGAMGAMEVPDGGS